MSAQLSTVQFSLENYLYLLNCSIEYSIKDAVSGSKNVLREFVYQFPWVSSKWDMRFHTDHVQTFESDLTGNRPFADDVTQGIKRTNIQLYEFWNKVNCDKMWKYLLPLNRKSFVDFVSLI